MKRKRLMTGVLFLLAVLLIVLLTFQNSEKSAELSDRLTDGFARFLWSAGLMKYDFIRNSGFDYVFVRKLGHTAEYFLLGIASMLLFRKSRYGLLKAAALCAVISFSDQIIKSFLPGREFDWTDFPYDFFGYVSGTAAAFFFGKKGS